MRAVMTGESEGSGITWQDWGVSEFEKRTAWTLDDKVNEWWFLLVLVIVIKLVCLILPSLQCLHAHSVSPGHVLCLPLACRACWVRGSGSYKAVHIVIVRCTQMVRVFSSLPLFGHFIDWTTASRACRRFVLQGQLPLPAVFGGPVLQPVNWSCPIDSVVLGRGRKTGSGRPHVSFVFLGNEA